MAALHWNNTPNWIFIVLAQQQFTGRHVAPPEHIISVLAQQHSTGRHVVPLEHIISIPNSIVNHYLSDVVAIFRPDFTRTTKKRKLAKSEVLNIL